jgi:hypothetical protein
MKNETQTKIFFYPALAILTLSRKRAFWVVAAVLLAFWFFWGREKAVEAADAEAFVSETLKQQPQMELTEVAEPLPALQIGLGRKTPDSKLVPEEFTFAPEFTEGVTTRFHKQQGRLPTDWKDLEQAGVVTNVPAAPKGFKYVYDAQLGLMEMVSE